MLGKPSASPRMPALALFVGTGQRPARTASLESSRRVVGSSPTGGARPRSGACAAGRFKIDPSFTLPIEEGSTALVDRLHDLRGSGPGDAATEVVVLGHRHLGVSQLVCCG